MAKKDGEQAVAKKAPAIWTPGKEEIFIDAYTKRIPYLISKNYDNK